MSAAFLGERSSQRQRLPLVLDATTKPALVGNWEPQPPNNDHLPSDDDGTSCDGATNAAGAPFDGMSCVAFKMDFLQQHSTGNPHCIAHWEPTTTSATTPVEQFEGEQ